MSEFVYDAWREGQGEAIRLTAKTHRGLKRQATMLLGNAPGKIVIERRIVRPDGINPAGYVFVKHDGKWSES